MPSWKLCSQRILLFQVGPVHAQIRLSEEAFNILSLCCCWRGGLAVSHRARVQRGESATARCASTGATWASSHSVSLLFPPLLLPSVEGSGKVALDCACPTRAFLGRALREQRGHLAAPFSSHPFRVSQVAFGWRLPGSPHARSGVPTPGGVRVREGWRATGPESPSHP